MRIHARILIDAHSQPKDVDSMTVSDFDSFDVKDYSKMYAKIAEYGTSYNDTVVTSPLAKVVEGKDYFFKSCREQ